MLEKLDRVFRKPRAKNTHNRLDPGEGGGANVYKLARGRVFTASVP